MQSGISQASFSLSVLLYLGSKLQVNKHENFTYLNRNSCFFFFFVVFFFVVFVFVFSLLSKFLDFPFSML